MNIGFRQIIFIFFIAILFFGDIPKISKKLLELGIKLKNKITNNF